MRKTSRDSLSARKRASDTRPLCFEPLENRYLLAGVQTTGLFVNSPDAFDGFTLFNPQSVSSTYLINNDGDVVNRWDSQYRPGLMGYLMPDGSLIRAGTPAAGPNPTFAGAAGGGGRLEWTNWEGDVLWQFQYDQDNSYLTHHDIEVIWNDDPADPFRVFMIAWEFKTSDEAIQAGRDPSLPNDSGNIYPDSIIEVKPILDAAAGDPDFEVVWEWHLWDHVVQEYDNTKGNFGDVSENPQLADINKIATGVGAGGTTALDWTHANGLSYNPDLDLLLLSVRHFSEFWVIDHSTTSAEAADHRGGNFDKGGDIIFRWGDPTRYEGADESSRTLWYQHDATWVLGDDPDPNVTSDDSILVFNNGWGRPTGDFSSAVEIAVPTLATDPSSGVYQFNYPDPQFYGPTPTDLVWSYDGAAPRYFSPVISGAERLENGNTLISFGTSGTFVEVDQEGKTVWEYVNRWTGDGPLRRTEEVLPRGPGIPVLVNAVFKARRYAEDYFSFAGQFTRDDLYPNFQDTPGLLNPSGTRWVLNNSSGGSIDDLQQVSTPEGQSDWIPVTGDWDGDGRDSVGFYDDNTNTWRLYGDRAADGTVEELTELIVTPAPKNWVPISGDWDGDGQDSIGLYDPIANRWRLNNRNRANQANDVFRFRTRPAPKTWHPVTGDWDGDGIDSIGLFNANKNTWHLYGDRFGDGSAEDARQVFRSPVTVAAIPIVSDWNGDGEDSVGLYDPQNSHWYLNNRNASSEPNDVNEFQTPRVDSGWKPIVGNWDGSSNSLLLDSLPEPVLATYGSAIRPAESAAGILPRSQASNLIEEPIYHSDRQAAAAYGPSHLDGQVSTSSGVMQPSLSSGIRHFNSVGHHNSISDDRDELDAFKSSALALVDQFFAFYAIGP